MNIEEIKQRVFDERNTLKNCPCCNAIIEDRTIGLNTSRLQALYRVCQWLQEKGGHEFHTKDVKHLWDKTQYATFGDWVWFGWLVYKIGKAHYGLNMDRVRAYFKGETEIPLYVTLDQINKRVIASKLGKINEVKKITEWLDSENKLYQHKLNPYEK